MFEIVLSLAVVAAIIMMWVSLYDTHHFTVTHKEFSDDRIKKPCRFVMLSDLHGWQYGRENEVLLKAIREETPDGILIVGDMFTAHKKFKTKTVEKLLADLKEICPVYYANGNHEHKLKFYGEERFGKLPAECERILKETKVCHLVNGHVSLPEFGICIYGLDIEHKYYKRGQNVDMPENYTESLLGKVSEEEYSILLAHNPEYFENYASWGAGLVLSGHVHGGIMRLPILGGVIAPSLKLFPKYDAGIFTEGKSTMVLGRGIGTHSPNVRFFNPGELVVLEFTGENG